MASQSSSDLETISKKQTLIDMYPNVVLTQGQKSACRVIWSTDIGERTLVASEFIYHILN